MVNISLYNRVKYTLTYEDLTFVVNESIGWKNEHTDYERHETYHGIFTEITDNIEFANEGADFIRSIYKENGANADITLLREVMDDITDFWVTDYTGIIDLTELTDDGTKVSVKLNSGGLITKIKARQNEKIEIERLTDLSGDDLAVLSTETLALDGRKIELISQAEKNTIEQFTSRDNYLPNDNLYRIYRSDQSERTKVAILNDLTSVSDTHFNEVLAEGDTLYDTGTYYVLLDGSPTTNMMFYADSTQDKTVTLKLDFAQQLSTISTVIGTQDVVVKLMLYKYENGASYDNETLLATLDTVALNTDSSPIIQYKGNFDVDLSVADSLALVYEMYFPTGGSVLSYDIEIQSTTIKTNITQIENSYYAPSTSKMVMAYELGERLTNIIGGEFESDLLGRTGMTPFYETDGDLALTGFVSGHWIRQFSDTNDLYNPFTTSIKDYIASLNTIHGIGIDIETVGFTETLNIREKDYYYQKFVGITIGDVKDVTRTVARDKYYSSIEVGYKEPKGDNLYEEAMGLDEYNVKTDYVTPITKIDNKLSILSPYRADSYGEEFARRQAVKNDPTKDTRYDKHIWIEDVERSEGVNYIQSKYSDDFDSIPTGVFSPETATNLRFTPARLILQHSKYIKPCIRWNNDDYIRYISSDGNSNLTTVKDTVSLTENDDILISDLDNSRYYPEWLEFERPIDNELQTQIKGSTDGVPNIYGLVEIEHKGKIERGFLFSITDNKNFKLLKVD